MKRFLIALAAIAAASPAGVAGLKTFKAWSAVCDNLRTCVAFGFPPADQPDGGYLRIARSGAAGAVPRVTLGVISDDAPKAAAWTPLIDGRPIAGVPALAVKADDSYRQATLTPTQGAALIEALRNGGVLTLRAGGATVATISLGGSAAALLWIDDQQQRIGTVTALARRGDKPAGAVPAVPALPMLRPGPPASQAGLPTRVPAAVRRARKDCTANPAADNDAPLIARLAPGVVLWGPVCDQGAYSIGNTFFIGDERGGALRPVLFPEPPGLADKPSGELSDPEYDEKTRILTSFAKGRGLGDCGEMMSWVWDGKAFQLLGATVMTQCHGVAMDDWPTLWVAKSR